MRQVEHFASGDMLQLDSGGGTVSLDLGNHSLRKVRATTSCNRHPSSVLEEVGRPKVRRGN